MLQFIVGDGTPKKAFLTALVVGTILTLINHGDLIFAGEMPSLWKVGLTYCVPFCVTTWGAVAGKHALWRRHYTAWGRSGGCHAARRFL
ncbi:MAG: nitrate/nitrite transporter NrtS [Rhodospirillaceae bacterium]|nr:nitrate/nitrite transporter NrtS [Rhodospirillaceae bacterium]MBT6510322.1 nitrate/nitrite transporter NrtS [Rhodospirillaceae bacterium]MBT7614789.1 nitrate/nitrite transporter NrtS [Rhodospirillaceae bacterium]MBT7647551.1 nitrate/nitrite transporter NrtS [Rhodospirillaceae bacterium]